MDRVREDIFELTNNKVDLEDELTTKEVSIENREDNDSTVYVHEEKQLEGVRMIKGNVENKDESLVELSSSKLYGDIFELEKSDMEISDSESKDPKKKAKATMMFANGKGFVSKQKIEGDGHLSDPEEGEILELAPAAEDVALLSVGGASTNEKRQYSTPAINEYYNRLGKIFSEAKRMSLEIRKGFSQLFSEDQLKAFENQINQISQQGIPCLPKTDEKAKPNVNAEEDHTTRRSRSRSRRRDGRSSHRKRHHRSSRRRRTHSRGRTSRRRERTKHRTRSRDDLKRDRDYDRSRSRSKNDRDRSSHHRRDSESKYKDIQRSEIGKRPPSPRSFLKDSRMVGVRKEPNIPVVIDGKEKQRAKTLVNRQMKLISQHMDNANAKPFPNLWNFESRRSPVDDRNFKPSNHKEPLSKPTDIKCLQDLEYFMDVLRAKNRNKNMTDEEIFAQLNKMRHKENAKENCQPTDQDLQMEFFFKEMTAMPEKKKGLYFQSSSKAKFKDTFTEHNNERSGVTKPDNRSPRPTIKKIVPRTPVKFEMKTNKNLAKAANPPVLFSESDSDSVSSRRSSVSESESSEDYRSRSRDRRYRSRSRQRRRSYSSYSDYSSRSRTNSPYDRNTRRSNYTSKTERKISETRNDKETLGTNIPTSPSTACRKRSDQESDESSSTPTLEAKRQKLLKEYAEIENKLSVQMENNKKEPESDKALDCDATTDDVNSDKKKSKTKPSKKIVILGNKEHLKNLIISPTLKESLMSGTLKQGILLKLVKHRDKRRTIEVVKEDCDVLKNPEQDTKRATSPESKTTLEELEAFMDDLRLKQKPNTEDQSEAQIVISDFTPRESRFLDRHKLKRKAKLMACIAMPDKVANKEAKLLESMLRRNSNSEDESEMTKVMQKLKAENEAVMMGTNQMGCPKKELVKIASDAPSVQSNIDTEDKEDPDSLPAPPFDDPTTTTTEVRKDYVLTTRAQNLLNRAKKSNPAVRGRKKRIPILRKPKPEEVPVVPFEEPLYPSS